jgi:hypothetical protein
MKSTTHLIIIIKTQFKPPDPLESSLLESNLHGIKVEVMEEEIWLPSTRAVETNPVHLDMSFNAPQVMDQVVAFVLPIIHTFGKQKSAGRLQNRIETNANTTLNAMLEFGDPFQDVISTTDNASVTTTLQVGKEM